MESKKRQRSANYTEQEKSYLLSLVEENKYIIEEKRTGGLFVERKRQAWQNIALSYNSVATSGCRDVEKLKMLYDNMKQKARKAVGEQNKANYIQRYGVTESQIMEAIQNEKEDKENIKKTGGGTWKPKIDDSNAKVLSIIQDQVEPLPNPYDSACYFFGDENEIGAEVTSQPPSAPIQDPIVNVTPTPQVPISTHACRVQAYKQVRRPNKGLLQHAQRAEGYKKLYFKKKCQNATLEQRHLKRQILFAQIEHKLKISIFQKQLENLRK